jgi:hypothetical protein
MARDAPSASRPALRELHISPFPESGRVVVKVVLPHRIETDEYDVSHQLLMDATERLCLFRVLSSALFLLTHDIPPPSAPIIER